LHGPKSYRAIGKFGEITDTLDNVGNVIKKMPFNHITKEQLDQVLLKFVGKSNQIPPAYSAKKIKGIRASDLTRAGEIVDLKPSEITIQNIVCTKFELPYFTIECDVGGGCYIRSLIRDIAEHLNTCAYTTELQRTKQGPFTLDIALDYSNMSQQIIEKAISDARHTIRF